MREQSNVGNEYEPNFENEVSPFVGFSSDSFFHPVGNVVLGRLWLGAWRAGWACLFLVSSDLLPIVRPDFLCKSKYVQIT